MNENFAIRKTESICVRGTTISPWRVDQSRTLCPSGVDRDMDVVEVGLLRMTLTWTLHTVKHRRRSVADFALRRRRPLKHNVSHNIALLCDFVDGRRLYWSDCSQPTTIQTASAIDGSDRRTLISDAQHSCITALVIDTSSQSLLPSL